MEGKLPTLLLGSVVLVSLFGLSIGQSDNLTVILPYQGYQPGQLGEVSYVIDNKRFIDSAPSRCLISTAMDDPSLYEPSFAFIRQDDEVSLNATVPADQITQAGFQPDRNTIIIVHGWPQVYPTTEWLVKARALARQNQLIGSTNVFFMNYQQASQVSYLKSAALSGGQGAFLTNFLMKLKDLGQNLTSVHLIGFSLGGQIVGFAGKRLQNDSQIGRITALDPAGPCFGVLFDNGPNDRLGPRDARYVRAFKYDTNLLGEPKKVAQIDVLVNGGSSQPNTSTTFVNLTLAFIDPKGKENYVISEDHARATQVATTQLTGLDCQEVAYNCSDYDAFSRGECGFCDQNNNQCDLMSLEFQYTNPPPYPIKSSNINQSYYIATSGREPYCKQHYQILVRIKSDLGVIPDALRSTWQIQMAFPGDSNNVTITNQLEPNLYTYLRLTDTAGKVTSASIRIVGLTGSPIDNNRYSVTSVRVNYMSNIDPQVRQSLSSRLCAQNGSAGSGGWLQLQECA